MADPFQYGAPTCWIPGSRTERPAALGRPLSRLLSELVTSQVANAIANARSYEVECKRAEALASIDRAKTAFFNNVSHEFRTPLTLMLGPLEDELRENPQGRERLEIAHRNSLRLLKLVNTLLDFARSRRRIEPPMN